MWSTQNLLWQPPDQFGKYYFNSIAKYQTSMYTIKHENLLITDLWSFSSVVHERQKIHEVWNLTFEESVIVVIKIRLWPRTDTTREHSHNSIIRFNATMIGEGQLTVDTALCFRGAPINLSALWSAWRTQLEAKQSQLEKKSNVWAILCILSSSLYFRLQNQGS